MDPFTVENGCLTPTLKLRRYDFLLSAPHGSNLPVSPHCSIHSFHIALTLFRYYFYVARTPTTSSRKKSTPSTPLTQQISLVYELWFSLLLNIIELYLRILLCSLYIAIWALGFCRGPEHGEMEEDSRREEEQSGAVAFTVRRVVPS